MFGPLKNMEVGLDDISYDKMGSSINVIINKIQRTFTSINIVKSFEKSGIYHRTSGQRLIEVTFKLTLQELMKVITIKWEMF